MAMSSGPGTWGMHGKGVPGLAEYLLLADAGGWGELVATDEITVGFSDALIVMGMQNDYLPVDSLNPHGGSLGILEGQSIVPLVVDLMEHFASQGGTVVVARDYHPRDHCSFIDSMGSLPTHCVQGTAGSHFYRPIGECIQKLRQSRSTEGRCEIVFKGFHEDIDSPGGFEYPESGHCQPGYPTCSENYESLGGSHYAVSDVRSSLSSWTGASVLKCSNLDTDVNAPPDVLAAHRRVTLPEFLVKKNAQRVFVCGLCLDDCVLGTAANAASAGFPEVFMILDASRAGHLSGIGKIGSGFLQDPASLTSRLVAGGVKLIPTGSVLPSLLVVNPITVSAVIKGGFPTKLGPFSLTRAKKIALYVDRKAGTYRAVAPLPEIRQLEQHGVSPEGTMAPPTPLTLDAQARERAGIPGDASEFSWAYPLGEGTFVDKARAYFAVTTPSAAFFIYGGFLYFDKLGRVVAVMAISLGHGLHFANPEPWPGKYSSALESRWCQVTAPFLREKGARQFCWINPGESLRTAISLGGEKIQPGEHGAFVYLFHDDLYITDERDVFFSVIPEEADEPSLDTNGLSFAEDDMGAFRQLRTTLAVGEGSKTAAGCVMKAFGEWDLNGSGTITENELTAVMKKMDPRWSDATIAKLFQAADVDRDGQIDFEEFVKWVYQS